VKDLGVLAPIVTPCQRTGEPDLAGLRSVADDLARAGVRHLFALGSTGRGPWFARREQAAVCRALAERLPHGGVLFAGCIAPGLPGMIENARAMAEAGAGVAVATAPPYFTYNLREIEAIFLTFADRSPLPVVVYDIPAFTGLTLDPDLVLRLARHPNIVGFKDSSGDFERFGRLAEALEDRPGFWLLQGKEEYLADSLRAGASGFVVSFVHFAPWVFTTLYRAVRNGDGAKADALQAKVNAVCRVVRDLEARLPEVSRLFHLLDLVLRHRGVCGNLLLSHEAEPPEAVRRAAERIIEILEL